MPLSNRSNLDPRWSFWHRGISRSFQICDVEIYNQDLGSRVYDPITNSYDDGNDIIWKGKARVQPTKISSERNISGNPTFVRQVNFQIDFNRNEVEGATGAIADIRPGHYITILNSPLDETLENFVYIVRTVMNSSNPWQRTITCEVDLESDVSA